MKGLVFQRAGRVSQAGLFALFTMTFRSWLPCTVACMALFTITTEAISNTERVAKLRDVRETKHDGVLALNTASFRKYVEVSKRSYSLIVLVGADAKICEPCPVMRKELGSVAKEFYRLPESSRGKHDAFFAELKVSADDREFLSDYGIQHVPMLVHIGPGSSKKYPTPLRAGSADVYDVQKLGVGGNGIRQFVNDRMRSRLRVIRGDYQIPFVSTVRAVFPLIVLCAITFGAVALALGWPKQPMFWFALSVIVYMYSVGGGHFSWINNSPFAVVDKNGVARYVSDGSRNQYVAEGAVVAVLCSVISGIAILINELPRLLPNKNSQSAAGHVLCGLGFLSVRLLLSLYDLKMPAYMRYEA